MATEPKTIDELMREWEPERQAEIARADASYEASRPRREAERRRIEEQIEREIAQGVRNPDGSPIEDIEDDEEED